MRKLMLVVGALAMLAGAQTVNPSYFAGMKWRLVGPFRAGRISAVAGVAGDAATYYIGNPGGGVDKSTSGGEVWTPVFDHLPGGVPVDSIGAIAVAPSDPNIVYVGTGDVDNVGGSVNQGDGVWRSADAGGHWMHVGLDDTRHIGAMVVDPHDPNIVLVAALGHTFAPNDARGVYRTTDGGAHWAKVLYRGPEIGAISLVADAQNPRVMFAGMEMHAPGGRGAAAAGAGAGIYKSTDEGATWTVVSGHGLPDGDMGRIGLAVQGQRVYAIVSQGLYRSDDGGATWTQATEDRRIVGSSYFGEVYMAPDNPDVVYVCQTSLYRSTDGGHTFIAFKGAPGGDDYHEVWIDPTNAQRMILGVDQGATITLNGGKDWSLGWYNLANSQFYHIAVDNQFPYWIYGTQQDSGSAAVASRGDFGETTFMDWRPSVGAYEFGYIRPDLTDANFVYATGGGTALNRYNWKTKQIYDITPPAEVGGLTLRYAGSPQAEAGGAFYLGAQAVLATRDRGMTWQAVSGDLTGGGRAAITTLGTGAGQVMWAGTNDGHVAMTADGRSWKTVASPAAGSVEMIEASPLEAGTAFAVYERHTANDFAPYIYRTTDGGAHWTLATAGLPPHEMARVVRCDLRQPGLVYAGLERGVYVSFDNGDRWQPLQLNLPPASVRDLAVHGDDLIAATYGRALWILDDVAPLRELGRKRSLDAVTLFAPAAAVRVQADVNYDTPFPPEMATGENPPAGAVIDYYLPRALGMPPYPGTYAMGGQRPGAAGGMPAGGEVTIGIYDAQGGLVRMLTSAAPAPEAPPELDIPNYWLAEPHPLPKTAGMHRVVWDMRYTAPASFTHVQPIAALLHDTPGDPRGPYVTPGQYEVRLTVGGTTYRAPLRVTMDPRVTTPEAGLDAQRDLELKISGLMQISYDAGLHEAAPARGRGRGGRRGGRGTPSFRGLNQTLGNLLTLIELSDDAPTATMRERYEGACEALRGMRPQTICR